MEENVKIIKSYIASLPQCSGVYRMISDAGEVLYVGKAKSLKKRVASYTHFEKLPERLQRMVCLTAKMEFINTGSEADALLLEANLIKKYKPRFNILLRDDKSFPYIVLKQDHDFPQILKHRGAKTISGKYFGPFPSAGDVNRVISALQRAFLLRDCSDSYFANRTRPCLQYHIKRCAAPCVGRVDKDAYAKNVVRASDFMQGKSRAVQDELTIAMNKASDKMDYESAALFRDRIAALTSIQAKHEMNSDIGEADVIAITQSEGISCIQIFFYRSGQNLGNKSYFPRHDKGEDGSAVIAAFIAQFYQNKSPPKNIIVNEIQDKNLLEEALSINIFIPKRGKYKQVIDFALNNAHEALKRHLSQSATRLKMRTRIMELFNMDDIPRRIEVYDNSHISGTNMVGAMIVEGEEGFLKKAYRKFNIKQAGKADDYAMMREVLSRRFRNGYESENSPDLLLIDGGAGQLSACREVLEELGILDQMNNHTANYGVSPRCHSDRPFGSGGIFGDSRSLDFARDDTERCKQRGIESKKRLTLVAIAKGADRNAGREKFFMAGREMFQLPINDPVLHYLQRLRDEAHRFAITTHRARRAKALISSPLDNIEGIGAKRKKALLLHFGSAKAIESVSIDELLKVEGISRSIAQKIYDYFH